MSHNYYITDPYKDLAILNKALRRLGEIDTLTSNLTNLTTVVNNAAPTTINNTTIQTGAAGSNKRVIISLTASFTTSGRAVGLVPIGKTATIISATVPAACRVRLYADSASQSADVNRDVNTYPSRNTMHGVILDLNLDSSYSFPKTWVFSGEGLGSSTSGSANLVYAVDTYGTVTGTAFSALTIEAPPPTGSDTSNPYGNSYNEWVAPSAGTLIRVNGASTYSTQAWFLDSSRGLMKLIGVVGASSTTTAIVPSGAGFIRCYAASGHFADITQGVDEATAVTASSITIPFTVLQEEF